MPLICQICCPNWWGCIWYIKTVAIFAISYHLYWIFSILVAEYVFTCFFFHRAVKTRIHDFIWLHLTPSRRHSFQAEDMRTKTCSAANQVAHCSVWELLISWCSNSDHPTHHLMRFIPWWAICRVRSKGRDRSGQAGCVFRLRTRDYDQEK